MKSIPSRTRCRLALLHHFMLPPCLLALLAALAWTNSSRAQVTGISLLNPNPTSAATLQWGVTFGEPVGGVTATNFVFRNPDAITGLAITDVEPVGAQPSTNWTVTAGVGTGNGILGLNWAGHASESPSVTNSFEGESYDFFFGPVIGQDPASTALNAGTTTNLTIVASLRGGGSPSYQWYSGSSATPDTADAISGATNSSYPPPPIFVPAPTNSSVAF